MYKIILRQYKIYSYRLKVNEKYKKIFDFIEEKFTNLIEYKADEMYIGVVNTYYYFNKSEFIFTYSKDNYHIYLNNSLKDILINKYNLSSYDIERLILYIIKNKYKIRAWHIRIINNSTIMNDPSIKKIFYETT